MLYIYNLYLHITYNNKVVTVTAMMPHPTIQTNSFSRVDHLSRTSHCSRDFHNITHQGTKPPDVDQVWKSIRTKPGKGSISLEFLECKATHFGGAYYIYFFFLQFSTHINININQYHSEFLCTRANISRLFGSPGFTHLWSWLWAPISPIRTCTALCRSATCNTNLTCIKMCCC